MELAKLYRAFRSRWPRIAARDALAIARQAQALGPQAKPVQFTRPSATERERESLFRGIVPPAHVYWRPSEYPRESVVYNPRAGFGKAAEWKPATGKHVRWIESTKRAGLRLVGFADEIAKAADRPRMIEHTGWYADPLGDGELFRGIVFRLPSRNGRAVFVYGYADPNNDGAALLCFDNDADDELEAARYADGFAERMAESEREYQTQQMAADRASEARAAVKESRAELRQIREQLAACRKRCKNWRKSKRYSALLGAVRNEIARLRAQIERELRTASQLDAEPWTILDGRF